MGIAELWLPIIVAAVVVCVASALVWTVLPWHRYDFARTPDEAALRAALKDAKPGSYVLPYCAVATELRSEEVQRRFTDGPRAYLTVVPNGLPRVGGQLLASFAFCVGVSALCAYVAALGLPAGAAYLDVFRMTAATAFLGYGAACLQDSIWFGRPWSISLKNLADAMIYGLLTGGVFGWLYP